MSNRITQADLDHMLSILNRQTNSPIEHHTKDSKGKLQANPKHYYFDQAYGGIKLVRVCADGQGQDTISTDGFDTKRKLWDWMHAYLQGLRAAKV